MEQSARSPISSGSTSGKADALLSSRNHGGNTVRFTPPACLEKFVPFSQTTLSSRAMSRCHSSHGRVSRKRANALGTEQISPLFLKAQGLAHCLNWSNAVAWGFLRAVVSQGACSDVHVLLHMHATSNISPCSKSSCSSCKSLLEKLTVVLAVDLNRVYLIS